MASARSVDRDQDLLGHVYAGPYLVGQRSLARVVDDGTGVSGYLFGRADTAAFEAWAEREWWPPLCAVVGPARQNPAASNSSTVPTYPETTSTRVPTPGTPRQPSRSFICR